MARAFEGGCLCGQVRYRVTSEPKAAAYCHCRMCQRATGAPVTAWVRFPTSAVRFTGEMKAYESSPERIVASARIAGHHWPR